MTRYHQSSRTFIFAFGLAAVVAACSDDPETAAETEDYAATLADFTCILDWPQVNRMRVRNMLGYQAEAEAVAASDDGGVFPVGTIVQVFHGEAMVKRGPDFSPATNNWEFFMLDVAEDGSQSILQRGGAEVANDANTCLGCHRLAEDRFDLICEDDHGCDPLPIPLEDLIALQNSDPRCN